MASAHNGARTGHRSAMAVTHTRSPPSRVAAGASGRREGDGLCASTTHRDDSGDAGEPREEEHERRSRGSPNGPVEGSGRLANFGGGRVCPSAIAEAENRSRAPSTSARVWDMFTSASCQRLHRPAERSGCGGSSWPALAFPTYDSRLG